MRATFIYAWTQFKRFYRDPVSLFFTLGLPLIFLLIFGSIFRGSDNLSFNVAVVNNSTSEISQQFVGMIDKTEVFNVKDVDDAHAAMRDGDIGSIIELPETFGAMNEQGVPRGTAKVYYSEAEPESGNTIASIVQSMLAEVNAGIVGEAPFTVEQQSLQNSGLSSFDYVIPGLIGFSIMSLAVFGLANQFPYEKKTGTLRRLRATPLSKTQVIFGTLLYYGGMGVVSLILMIAVAIGVLGFDMRGDWLTFGIFLIFSMAVMLGFGLLVGGIAKNENQAAVATNIVAFPMMFLSGAFFPRMMMPEWLQAITDYIPLTPVIDGIRMITAEAASLVDVAPQLLIMSVWFVVVYILAIRLFRWE